MRIKQTIGYTVCLALAASYAYAGDPAALEQLDKEWGSATSGEAVRGLVSDDIIGVSPEGVGGKEQILADSDSAAEEPYVAGDYQTRFLSEDVAVMVHSAGGAEPHWSMHVWQQIDGNWQVVATASIPKAE
jgi:hypothetical protein